MIHSFMWTLREGCLHSAHGTCTLLSDGVLRMLAYDAETADPPVPWSELYGLELHPRILSTPMPQFDFRALTILTFYTIRFRPTELASLAACLRLQKLVFVACEAEPAAFTDFRSASCTKLSLNFLRTEGTILLGRDEFPNLQSLTLDYTRAIENELEIVRPSIAQVHVHGLRDRLLHVFKLYVAEEECDETSKNERLEWPDHALRIVLHVELASLQRMGSPRDLQFGAAAHDRRDAEELALRDVVRPLWRFFPIRHPIAMHGLFRRACSIARTHVVHLRGVLPYVLGLRPSGWDMMSPEMARIAAQVECGKTHDPRKKYKNIVLEDSSFWNWMPRYLGATDHAYAILHSIAPAECEGCRKYGCSSDDASKSPARPSSRA